MCAQEVFQLDENVDGISETLLFDEKMVSSLKAEISKEEQELKSIKTKKIKRKKVDEITVKPALLDGAKRLFKGSVYRLKTLAKKQIVDERKKKKLLEENIALKKRKQPLKCGT